MTTGQEIALIVSILGGICGIVFGVVAILRNRKQDDTADGKESGDKQYKEILRDLTAVQESAKQAHHRIDGIERRINEN